MLFNTAFYHEQFSASVTVAEHSHNVLGELETTHNTAAFSGFRSVKSSFSMNSLQYGAG